MRIINKSLRCVFPIVFFVIGGFMFTGCVLYKNKIMAETAKAIVHDLVWGGRATERAIEYGDKIIPLIEKESDDFRALNGRNALWIAEVLGATETEKAKAVLFELYSRSNTISRLTGAIGLAQQGLFPDVIDERSFLVQIVRQDPSQSETQLAIIALGRTRNPKAIPCLLDFLRKRPSVDYWLNAYACQAIARIGSSDAIPVLRDCLRSDSFYALPEALRTLISLGDKDAIPLARIIHEN